MALPDFGKVEKRVDDLTAQMAELTQALGDHKLAGAQAVEIAVANLHREWQHPQLTQIAQTAAGFTVLGTPQPGLHYVKVLGAFITLDAAGTLQFFSGAGISATSPTDAALTGTIDIATNGGFVLPVTGADTPWLWTASGKTLSLNTVTGLAQGWIVWCDSSDNQ